MRRLQSWLAPVAVFSVGFFFFHRQEILSGWDMMSGGRGDPRLVGFLLEHWYLVSRGVGHVLSPPMFYPATGTLGYTHALVGYLPLYLLPRWIGIDPWTSYQVAFTLADILNFASVLWLLRSVFHVERKLALFFAAFVTFNSVKFNQIGHQQLQILFYVVIALGLVAKAIQEAPHRSRLKIFLLLAGAAACLDVQLLTDVYNAWFLTFWACLWAAIALARPASREWIVRYRATLAIPVTGALLVLAIGLVPFLRIYLPVERTFGGWPYATALEMVPHWYSFFSMGDGNLMWGWLPVPRDYPYASEHHVGLGIAICLLGALVLAKSRSLPWVARTTLFAAILFVAIGFRYGDTRSPWQLVHAFVPGAQSLRAIARYVIVLTIPVAIGLGIGLTQLMEKWTVTKRRAVWALIMLAAFEQVGAARHYSKSTERAYIESLRPQVSGECETFYAVPPAGSTARGYVAQLDAMWLALLTGKPTLNGYSGHFPVGWDFIETSQADYQPRVARWIEQNRIQGRVCRVDTKD